MKEVIYTDDNCPFCGSVLIIINKDTFQNLNQSLVFEDEKDVPKSFNVLIKTANCLKCKKEFKLIRR